MTRIRLACLSTHPIQYQAPLFRRIAREPDIDLTVLFCGDFSLRPHFDPGFGVTMEWDIPLLEGYRSEVLPTWKDWPHAPSFWQPFNKGLFRRLRQGRFDCLLIHGYNRFFHWQAVVIARLLNIRVLIRDEPTLISARRSPAKRAVKQAFFAGLNALVDGFLAIGTLNAAYYRAHGIPAHKIIPMPYTVDNHFFQGAPRQSPDELRCDLNIPDGAPIILYVSKLQRRKHPEHLLDAFRRLSTGMARTPYLVFVGEGERRSAVERLAADLETVRFVGFKGQQELPAYYGLCDVFVLPSVHETWGLVINEAMNLGKAIIASDQVGSAADLVRDGENGFIFPAGDIDALTDALRRTIEDPDRCAQMGRRSLEIINGWDFEADMRGLRTALRLGAAPPAPPTAQSVLERR